jgi:hypothetical protein
MNSNAGRTAQSGGDAAEICRERVRPAPCSVSDPVNFDAIA